MKKLLMPLLLLVAVSAHATENPVLTIEGGQVQGVIADDHPDVFVYRGIPYAAPPVKEGSTARGALEGRENLRYLWTSQLSGHSVYWWLLYGVGVWKRGCLQ